MSRFFKNISEYNQNILTLFTGTLIAQAIPIIISPILTRLYSPEDFGLYGLFISIVSILSVLVSGSYEHAIVLPEKIKDFINVTSLSVIITLFFSLFTLIFIILFNHQICLLLNNDEISKILYLIPLTILLTGLFNILKYVNIRDKKFKDISKVSVYKTITIATVQLLGGIFKYNVLGLVSGVIISNITTNKILFKNLKKYKFVQNISTHKIKEVAIRYVNFLKFQTPSSLLNSFSANLPTIIFSKYFNLKVVGFFSFTNRLLLMPTAIIGKSVGDVFLSEIIKLKNDKDNLKINLTIIRTLNKLILIGSISYSFLMIFGDLLFKLIFGFKWVVAGEMTQILSISLFFIFISAPLSKVFIIYEKQKQLLYSLLIIVIIRVSVLIYFSSVFKDLYLTLWVYSTLDAIYYLFILIYIFRITETKIYSSIKTLIIYSTLSLLTFYILRMVIDQIIS